MSQFLAFTALVSVLVLIPGPAVILVIQKAVGRGFRDALGVAAGVLIADLGWASAAAAGVTAVLVASEPAFLTLRQGFLGSGGVLVGFGAGLASEARA